MNLFSPKKQKVNTEQLDQIKAWVYESLDLPSEIPISLSQIRCGETDCPEVETAIAIMSNPTRVLKVHKPLAQINQEDITQSTI